MLTRLTLALAVSLVPLSAQAATSGRPTPAQTKRVKDLVSTAKKLERAKEPVRAYLYLQEAYRLEQLWSNNTFGDDALSKAELERFTTDLLRAEDGSLMKILHSPQVQISDKLNLVRVLEQEVIMSYPGRRAAEELLGPTSLDE